MITAPPTLGAVALLLAGFTGLTGAAEAQMSSELRRLSPGVMMDDLFLLAETLVREHGGLRRYTPEEELNEAIEDTLVAIEEEWTVLEFYRRISGILSSVRCGHTSVRMSDPDLQAVLARNGMLPLDVHLDGTRAWVKGLLCDARGPEPGVEILTIAGLSIEAIRTRALAHLPGDGFTETNRERNLERSFARCFALYVDDRPDGQTSFRVRCAGADEELELPAISPAEYMERSAKAAEDRPNVLFEFRAAEDVGILSIQQFGDSAGEPDFAVALETGFARLRSEGVGNLVLDLRGNGGGTDMYGALLVSYLASEPFGYFERIEVTPEYDGPGGVVAQDGLRLVTAHPGLQVQEPAANRFEGPVYFLIDGWTFSTAADVATVAHHHGLATFIGEEVGGGYDGNTSGSSVRLDLEGSGLRVSVPQWMYTTANVGHAFPGRGVPPDHHVRPTVEDVLSGRDAELEFALALIRDG